MTRQPDPLKLVYAAAEAVSAAYMAISKIPFGEHKALDTLLDGKVFPADLNELAAKLSALADDWQAERDEAEDRRRANPLEPDFRRL